MLKSTLIAKCLLQCYLIQDLATGEGAVESIFEEYFPRHSFSKWNTHLPDNVVSFYLRVSEGSDTIRVDSFIEDLWDL
ncbi:hypothetical protein ID858_15145 [Xenorhabdus sp. DI]|uniref:hypothetical protein n=1 Tax=Xenorhabdus doucetiae TaxID=351671 RepID=UPI0019876F9F|nr:MULTISPECIES: hypothetical protein [unclassified Xenorhabdus]MBD2786310.1 hypothetical protein [Xenorhabdus sp. 3]MBD2789836.1 hypothetical protein [Xenorhabdus sp. DI]